MALELSSLVEWLLTGGVGALIVRETFKSVKYRKDNGTRNFLLNDMNGKLTVIGKKQEDTRVDMEVIKTELKNFNERCVSHLANQQGTNEEIKGHLNLIDEKLYQQKKKR